MCHIQFLLIIIIITYLPLKSFKIVHLQVGRSGRFGHLGLAVNLITYEDRFNLYVFFF